MKRPAALWILVFWMLLLALGGLYGGISMLIDPSGNLLQMAEVLPLLHVPDYVLPGLFLLVGMGLAPLFLIYALIARPGWPWLERLFRGAKSHWAWIATLLLVAVLAAWLTLEAIMIGFIWPIQYVTAFIGLMILLFALLPPVRKFYAKQ
jgi:hypothetical protein